MTQDERPIAVSALARGVAVVSRSGRQFGTVDRVLEEPAQDIVHGIVVVTPTGRRLVSRDQLGQVTTARVVCELSDEQAATLPAAPPPDPQDRRRRWRRPGWVAWTGPVSVVRCSRGAVFQSTWVPLLSVTAIRLGPLRIQWCPVHQRVELVRRIDPRTMTPAERAQAARYPARPIP